MNLNKIIGRKIEDKIAETRDLMLLVGAGEGFTALWQRLGKAFALDAVQPADEKFFKAVAKQLRVKAAANETVEIDQVIIDTFIAIHKNDIVEAQIKELLSDKS